ncbi:unnamed protein product [Meganyctiphanes norvegica]|uniref:Uncharacterized protein n=1 Tax=Meganyctiphanes norvegica TaxID=48144 RepID=A0AAV2QFT0_MEGNR
MAPCSSRPTSACHNWHVVAVVVAACLCQACATACPITNTTDTQILITNKYVSYYFSQYSSDGEALSLEEMKKLLAHHHSYHAGSYDGHSHITHDHHPEPHSHGSHLHSINTDNHGNNHDHNHNHTHEQNDRRERNDSSRLAEITADMSTQFTNSSDLGHNHDHIEDEHVHHDHDDHIDHDHSHHKENSDYHENHEDDHVHHDHDHHAEHDPNHRKANNSSMDERKNGKDEDVIEEPSQHNHTDTHSRSDITNHMLANNAELKSFKCGTLPEYLTEAGLSIEDAVTAGGFIQLCPTLLYHMDVCAHNDYQISDGDQHHGHSHGSTGKSQGGLNGEKWLGAFISVLVIGLMGLLCIMLIPAFKRSPYYKYINPFLVALAVGTLSGDALIHLLPHAIGMPIPPGANIHTRHAMYGFTALVTIVVALFAERMHNLCGHGGHGHSHGHSHQTGPLEQEDQEYIKDIDTGTVEEDDGVQNLDKIGEKLSKHSKHNSLVYAESSMNTVGREAGDCFVNCPEVAPSSDANGNQGPDVTNSTAPATPEQERLVASLEKMDQELTPKVEIMGSPESGKRMPRQNSSNFNMMMSEYHVNHHGHSHHGHSHVTGKKDSLRYMILMGDAIHTALDGLAIGAAFGSSVTGGVATAIAVLCHELPHKVGDFALLFEMGLHWVGAVKMMGALWLFSVAGMVFGVLLGNIPTAAPWIYSLTAGVFIYLALVDLLAELPMNNGEGLGVALKMMLLQGAGMLVGASIMLAIAIYEHDLQLLLEGKF